MFLVFNDYICKSKTQAMNHFDKFDIKVFDKFIEKFAERYVNQRSAFVTGINSETISQAETINCGFDVSNLMRIIRTNSIANDVGREKGEKPLPFKDIFRSDLGELLTTYYFEEKIEKERRFLIPLKNISYRERSDMPGRGFDALGYRKDEDRVNLLIGEAKVSAEKRNPPTVVDASEDSIYKSQKLHHDNTAMVLQRLTDYVKRLNPSSEHFIVLAGLIIKMNEGKHDDFDITYGCGLVRDSTCVNEHKDFGKMQSNENEFAPGKIEFAIFSFSEKNIDETIDLFYHQVKKLTK